jgi:hypothetical protein
MDQKDGACAASFLPSWPSFPCLFCVSRTDNLVLAICDPFTGLIDGERAETVRGGAAKIGLSSTAGMNCLPEVRDPGSKKGQADRGSRYQ